ncbi:hypothetical protein Ancab_007142 [Ancistrocladus abbreviatus]
MSRVRAHAREVITFPIKLLSLADDISYVVLEKTTCTSCFFRSKANRAKRLLEKKATLKEEKKSAALAAGLDWESDDSDEEALPQPVRESPLPDLLKDEEHYRLIKDLCKALASLRRYTEALEIIKRTLMLSYKIFPAEKKEELRSLGSQIALNVTDPSDAIEYVRYMVLQHPESIAAWNCYYKLFSRYENTWEAR